MADPAENTRNIVWIASYPKSGNTWARFMACNLLFGSQSSASALNTMSPDIHEWGSDRLADHSGLVKTHFPYSSMLPLAERTAAAIYVVRQPDDVLVSNFHYSQRSTAGSAPARDAFDRYVDQFLQHRGDPYWIERGMGSWEENVRSWLDARSTVPVVLVRYEDLHAAPQRVCAQLAQLFAVRRSPEQLDEAVKTSSFEKMRDVEDADIREQRIGIFYKPYLQGSIDAGRRFMRSGVVGEAQLCLSPAQQARIAEVFGPTMRQLGYVA
jgi:Sulfotransferase domain